MGPSYKQRPAVRWIMLLTSDFVLCKHEACSATHSHCQCKCLHAVRFLQWLRPSACSGLTMQPDQTTTTTTISPPSLQITAPAFTRRSIYLSIHDSACKGEAEKKRASTGLSAAPVKRSEPRINGEVSYRASAVWWSRGRGGDAAAAAAGLRMRMSMKGGRVGLTAPHLHSADSCCVHEPIVHSRC